MYILDSDVTVGTGVTLRIGPGVVIKAKTYTSLYVNGRILAVGAESQPIYFTSWHDDTLCGDTNGNGGATVPASGDWGAIQFSSGTRSSVIRRAVLRYGGTECCYHYGGAIRLANTSPTLENISMRGNYRNEIRT